MRWFLFLPVYCLLFLFPAFPVNAAIQSQAPLPSQVPCSCYAESYPTFRLVNPAVKDPSIKILQEQLLLLGLNPGPADGSYGPSTRDAVLTFQRLRHIPPDGAVTGAVWREIYLALQDRRLEDPDPASRLSILIDRHYRTLTVYAGTHYLAQYKIAVGTSNTPSPLGDFRVVHKSLNWGSGFGTRWMGLNVPWGIYGIHGTNKPDSIGAFSSHGCFRMFNRSVEQLYRLTPVGTPVIVFDSSLAAPRLGRKTISPGSAGQRVVYLQWRLQSLGIPLVADGQYGRGTAWAVRYFQVTHLLAASGIADQQTLKALQNPSPIGLKKPPV